MGFITGFYNSINKDRLYTAEDMNMPYKRIVSNGVFAKTSEESSTDFQVISAGSMNVIVQPGNAIFKDKWAELTGQMVIAVPTSHTLLNRIDSIIVRIDENESERKGSIFLRSGEYAETPTAPALIDDGTIKEYRLANITVGANVETISQDVIEDTRPTDECGWVHNLLWDSDITATYKQWQAQFNTWFNDIKQQTGALAGDIDFYNNIYTTSEDGEDTIALGIAEYSTFLDLLEVYVSGIKSTLSEYTFDEDTRNIIFTSSLDKGTTVEFQVFHKRKAGITFYNNIYTTNEDDENIIDLGIPSYTPSTDGLDVYVNGFKATSKEFSFNKTTRQITFAYTLDKGTTVEFVVFHHETSES